VREMGCSGAAGARVICALQTATRRGDSPAVEGQLLPLELSGFLNRAKPYSRLGNVLWCNYSDVRIAREIFSVKGQEVGDAVDLH
jgi:hypothetical protein